MAEAGTEANILDIKLLTTNPFFIPLMNCVETARILLLENSSFPSSALRGSCWAWEESYRETPKVAPGTSGHSCPDGRCVVATRPALLCLSSQLGSLSLSPPHRHGAAPVVGLC